LVAAGESPDVPSAAILEAGLKLAITVLLAQWGE